MSNDMETVYATLLIFGVLSAVLYTCVLRPFLPQRETATTASSSTNAPRNTSKTPATSKSARVPPHVSDSSAQIASANGRNLLHDNGVVGWKYSRAATHRAQENDVKDRARLLTRLLVSSSPPVKGGTVVLAVPGRDVGCPKLRHALYLLGTYYNLLVLLVVDPDFDAAKNKSNLVKRLRGDELLLLSRDVLPDHRIVLSCTPAGRVAFCRQMQRIELVLDFDPEVKTLLSRFGHNVTLYGEGFSSGTASDDEKVFSILGQSLSS